MLPCKWFSIQHPKHARSRYTRPGGFEIERCIRAMDYDENLVMAASGSNQSYGIWYAGMRTSNCRLQLRTSACLSYLQKKCCVHLAADRCNIQLYPATSK